MMVLPLQSPFHHILSMLNGKFQIAFKDNGIGIDLKKRDDQVFGLYKRLHHHIDGKGMGLYMAKTQVESMGGKSIFQVR